MQALPIIGAGMSIAGGGIDMAAAFAQADAVEEIGRVNEDTHYYNASVLRKAASKTREAAEKDAAGILMQGELAIGSARAQMAANGVDVNAVGESAMDYIEQASAQYASQAEYAKYEGEYQAWTQEEQARSEEKAGKLARYEAETQAFGLRTSGVSSLFKGTGNAVLSLSS